MDYLKNMLEDIVIEKVEKGFAEHPDICQSLQCKKDATVYILNSIKPRYIISTRGMLHEAANIEERQKIEAEIDALVPEALHRVNEHRRPNFDHSETGGNLKDILGKTERFTMTEGYHFNFPFFIGEVKSEKDQKPIDAVKVSLLLNDELLPGWDANWPNPYETSEKSAAKFAFWPAAREADNDTAISFKEMEFCITFEHKQYQTKEIKFTIKLESEKYIVNFVRKDYTKDLGAVMLTPA